MQILVAGVGNLLRGDDGFGVEVARALEGRSLPPEVRVVETGIGGIHLVQEMLTPADALLVIDAPLPSITADPTPRRDEPASDHAPVVATFDV